MSAPVSLIEAPADIPASNIGRLARRDLATVVITLDEQRPSASAVAARILAGLGKRQEVNGRARHGYDDVVLVPLWLIAHRTTTVYVAAPQHAATKNMLALAEMTAASTSRIVFVCDHGYQRRLADELAPLLPSYEPWPTQPGGPGPDRDEQKAVDWDADAPEHMPHHEFLTFYAQARRLLPTEVFAEVDRLYRATLTRTLAWLDQQPGEPHSDAMLTEFARTIGQQHTLDQVTVAVKAIQAAYFRRGWFLIVDYRELRRTLLQLPPPNLDEPTWRRLRAYRCPARAATVALFMSGLSINDINDLTVADLSEWHAKPDTTLRDAPIPGHARPYLRAHLLARTVTRADPAESAFLGGTRRITMDISQASTDLGIALGHTRLRGHHRYGSRILSNTIFELANLT